MYSLKRTRQFKKDLKTVISRGYDMSLIQEAVDTLAEGKKLDKKYNDHELSENWKGYRKCYILPDWL